jgi:hypothetical protein
MKKVVMSPRPAPIRALREEASGLSADPERLAELAAHGSKSVRLEVACNKVTPWQVLVLLTGDPDEQIRVNAAGNVNTVVEAQEQLSMSADKWVRAILAHTYARSPGSLARSIQLRLAEDDFLETRTRIAETTNFLDIFESFMSDPIAGIRASCAANPRIDREQMERLVTDRSAGVRAATIARGCLYPDDEQLIRLARDRSKGVQWAALFRADAPLEVVEVIAKESDEFNRRQAASTLANLELHRSQHNVEWRANERARATPGAFETDTGS